MVFKASDDVSPTRAAPEESLTLNRKQSWFGSFRSVVHRGAMSAKAAVESLRGGHSDSASTVDLEKGDTSLEKYNTPPRQSDHNGTSTSKSAVASLRQNLSRQSRHSRKRSISSIFRRSGSNASSLRCPRDPEAIIRNSQDMSKGISPLARDWNTTNDAATLVPLPSSPINIPPPAPTLRLDLGPPAMLSPFLMTSSDLAEIKVLQDPTNITTGLPPSSPMLPNLEGKPLSAVGYDSEVSKGFKSEQYDAFGLHTSTPSSSNLLHFEDPQNQFGRHHPCLSDSMARLLDCDENLHSRLEHNHLCLSDPSTRLTECHDPFQDELFSPKASQVPMALVDKRPGSKIPQNPEREPFHTTRVSSAISVPNPLSQDDAVVTLQDDSDGPVGAIQLPSSLVATKRSSTKRTEEVPGNQSRVKPVASPTDGHKAPPDAEVITARQKYRDSLAGLGESQSIEKLELEIIRHIEQNPFVGGPGAPGLAVERSASIAPTGCTETLESDFAWPEILDKVTTTPETMEPKSVKAAKESNQARRDSLFPHTLGENVHAHGPPSPTRSVVLPLRPKATPTKHNSFDSTLFKPILDRVAAQHLGVFRPGSDPMLRQKYSPHADASPKAALGHLRQPSLDSDDEYSIDTESLDAIRIFERTVEQPSPLHIRKQSGSMLAEVASSPQTPTTTSTPAELNSSPTRTPSMGDRQLFDLQRANRNARYNAILAGGCSPVADGGSDIQLAEFSNAGPGSQGSTPKRSRSGRGSDKCETPSPKGCATGLPREIGSSSAARMRAFWALSED